VCATEPRADAGLLPATLRHPDREDVHEHVIDVDRADLQAPGDLLAAGAIASPDLADNP
jgi:hypothetical protein